MWHFVTTHLWIVYLLVAGHLVMASMTLYLHRCQTHGGVAFHPVVSHFMRFILWFFTATVTKEWVAIHRKHHKFVDTSEDPHSPQIYGFWRVFFGGWLLYKQAAHDKAMLAKYGVGTPNDWIERHLYTPLSWVGIMMLVPILNFVLFGWGGLLVWIGQVIWVPFWAAGVVNGVGHFFGSRPLETGDSSRNLFPWWLSPLFAWFLLGEDRHNYHHGFPASARFTMRLRELDLGWVYIKLLSWIGLADIRRVTAYRLLA